MLRLPVYLDNNATTCCDPRVVEAMLPYFSQHYGNAASHTHSFGWMAEEAVDIARKQVASLIHADATEIVFTSGATESDNLAIKGVFENYAAKGNHIVTVATEHKAVLDSCRHIEKKGGSVTYLQVNSDGLIDLDELKKNILPSTVLIAVMYANNETGVIQPIQAISAIAREAGVLFFCDAAQAVGKINVDVINDGIDLLSISAHKMYGPKGVGVLYVSRKKPRVTLTAQMDGGGHERNKRSGTLNVPAIVGFGKACELCEKEMPDESKRLEAMRNRLEKVLIDQTDATVNGNLQHRLPHVTNLSFKGTTANNIMMRINSKLAVSSGSACTSALPEPSYVLKAMCLDDALANASLRFALGRFTTDEEIDFAIQEISNTVKMLREDF
ncbi:MAG: aminotransferase class V-fold PLP-dependent enzyme [Bacteroidetes bacterium]|nr:aminotransferase class V-fold PLP-dependent enzyme [Bacteroidota bacterium]